MSERILVIGAGMAGLWSAMALAHKDRQVIVLDGDPPPPEGDANAAFKDWDRHGVGQLRHSHAFLARLRTLVRDEYPDLLERLREAGCRELGFEGALTKQHRETYREQPGDADLAILTSRRTTLELVMRRYAEQLPGVTFRPETFVTSLLLAPGQPPTVKGVIQQDGRTIEADYVVDAAGRRSQVHDQLKAAGAVIPETSQPCGILYYTRHYRLRPGAEEPTRGSYGTTGDLGYLKFGVFPADNGCFSITLCAPEIEYELRKVLINPEVFDTICRQLPGVAPWIEPERTEGVSKVFGMGNLESRWRDYAPNGRPAVLRLFAVGDSGVRTNPLYGRGCSFAAVSAHALRDAFAESTDPARRLIAYSADVERELRPYDQVMRQADMSAIRRARAALMPKTKASLPQQFSRSFMNDGVAVAIREDVELLRAFLRAFHMLEPPQAWLMRPDYLSRITRVWLRGKARNADLYPPKAGPDRDEMFAALGLSPTADMELLRAEDARSARAKQTAAKAA